MIKQTAEEYILKITVKFMMENGLMINLTVLENKESLMVLSTKVSLDMERSMEKENING